MNRSFRESMIAGGRNVPMQNHRRGLSLNGVSKDADDNLDLFSKSRRSFSTASSDESEVSVKLGRLSIGSVKQVKSGLDDLLTSTDGGKHDYDWLLTPPGTPLVPSSNGNESQLAPRAPRSSSLARSTSTSKASRLSVSQTESNHPARPTRSSSASRPSISSSHYSTYSNKSSSVLNTSSASVSSYIRPSTPTSRSSSIARPSTPIGRPTLSRSSTPSKARTGPSVSSVDKPKPSQSSRPSTPTSRPQISSNFNSPASRSTSRPSTPTRRNSAPSLSPASGSLSSGGRASLGGRNGSSVSRPSSPSPRVRTPPQPVVPPDFSLETPPNLRTTLPDRPLSAGRSRPGSAVTVKGNTETTGAATLPRRPSSPVVSRGRIAEPPGRGRMLTNGHMIDVSDSRRIPPVSEVLTRKPVKSSSESTGFGRNISKKSLDMAIRHMDIRNGTNSGRGLSGSALFPQSIRSNNQKHQQNHFLSPAASVNGSLPGSNNGAAAQNGHHIRSSENGIEEEKPHLSAKLTNPDIYESSRYDMILLKEDLKNSNWLHSFDEKVDGGLLFDNGFEPLPEPFGPL